MENLGTNIYKVGKAFLTVTNYHGSFHAEAHEEGTSLISAIYVRYYKSEENAVRKAEETFGAKAELIGSTAPFFASSFVNEYEKGLRDGQWALVIVQANGDGNKQSARIICEDEQDAWEKYDSFNIRGTEYAAKKELVRVVLTSNGVPFDRSVIREEVNPDNVIL